MRTGSRKMRVMLTAALSLIVAVAMSSAVFAEADVRSEVLPDGAAYIDENGDTKILARDQFRIVGLDTDVDPAEFENGWYVLYGSGAVIKRIEIKGDVKLLLMNGFTTDFKNGIHVPKGSSLSIYGQSTDRDTSGVLIATGEKGAAGIGSNITPSIDKPDDCGIINVYGGVIRAEGGEGGAGIGGGYGLIKYDVEYGGDGGTYYQKYGWVEAVGGKQAAGLGGGRRGDSGTVTIDGGTLEATGGEGGAGIGGGEALVNASNFNSGGNSTFITINGGVVRAFGSGGGAGIGAGKGANGTKGGYDDPMDKRGCIKITGGNVTAFGSEGGAGIGGALNDINDWYEFAAGANVDISGGYINAKGGAEAAGIGSARSKAEGSGYTRIHGNAEVRAQGGDYAAGIGTGNEPRKLAVNGVWPKLYDIKIYESAKVYATGGKEAAGIGCGNEGQRSAGAAGKLEISDNAEVTAQGGKYGAGIGGGDQNVNGKITISGGTVNATGGYGGAGIGGGDDADDDSSAGDINISGGTVNANGGDYGAGIGAGDTSDMKCKLEITGGKVTATAGKEAAGIGGGNHTYFGGGGNGGNVKIEFPESSTEDYVLATSGEGASPIGHGQDADGVGTLTLGNRSSVKSTTDVRTFDNINGNTPDTFSERYEICKSDKVRTLLVQNCAHPNMKYTYVDDKKHLARCPSCGKSDEEGHIGGINEACQKCNYRGEYWRVTLKEGKDAEHTRELRVGKGLTTTFPEHLDKYVPENELKVKTHVFAGWASESVMKSLEGIDLDQPNEDEINEVRAALASLKKYGDEITPDGDTTYTAVYLKRASVRFTPGEDGIGDDRFLSEPPVMYSNIKLLSSASFISKDGEDLCGWTDITDKAAGQTTEYALGAPYFVTKPELVFEARYEKHVHNISAGHHAAVAATCETAGNIEFWVCSDCGRCFRDEACEYEVAGGDTVIPATGHAWDEITYSWNDNYTEVKAEKACLNDAAHSITETGTVSSVATDPTCYAEGKTVYTAKFTNDAFETQTKEVTIAKISHAWGEWKDNGDGTETRRCTNAGCTESETKKKDEAVHTHTMKAHDAVAPQCEKQGRLKYWECTSCKKNFADEAGTQEVTDLNSLRVPALGHDFQSPQTSVLVPATCEMNGVMMLTRPCSRCAGKSSQPDIPALGHDWDSGVVTTAASCTEGGVKEFTCLNDPEHKRTEKTEPLGHKWSEWTSVVEGGIKYDVRNCTRCSEVQKVASGDTSCPHTEHKKVEGIPATCMKEGIGDHFECANCGVYLKAKVGGDYEAVPKDEIDEFVNNLRISPLGHSWDDATYTWSADGSSVTAKHVCKRDSSHVETEAGRITEKIVREATESQPGEKIVTARFSSEDFDTQTKTIVIPKKPASPQISTTAKTKARAVVVRWNKIKESKKYKVAYRKAGSSKWTYKTTKKNKYRVRGRKMGSLYEFRVANVEAGGEAWSNTSYRYFSRVRFKVRPGKGSVRVSWKKDTGATGYQIRIATNRKMKNAQVVEVDSSVRAYKFSGLSSGKRYYVRVRPLKEYNGIKYTGILSGPKKARAR